MVDCSRVYVLFGTTGRGHAIMLVGLVCVGPLADVRFISSNSADEAGTRVVKCAPAQCPTHDIVRTCVH